MRTCRWILPTLALAGLLAAGCLLLSGQFLVSYELPTPLTVAPTAVVAVGVDLNTVAAYRDHRDDLKDLSDLAILGTLTNTGATVVDVDVWMTPLPTAYTDAAAVALDETAVKVWGPLRVSPGETKKIGWDASAALFRKGRAALLEQVKGDGVFTLYALGGTGSYSFRVDGGTFVAVISAGK
jgi:hypothetical protein